MPRAFKLTAPRSLRGKIQEMILSSRQIIAAVENASWQRSLVRLFQKIFIFS